MKFEYDIYISYSKKDNQILSGSDKGWVSNFHKYLEIRLAQLLGYKPKFLHYSNEEKPSAAELAKACVMISVISPDYCKAADCAEDIEVFYEEALKNQTPIELGDKSRFYKITKFPVPFDLQHSKIRSFLGYDMFETDSNSGTHKEVQNFFDVNAEKSFWMKLDDLAHDVCEILREVNIQRELSKQTDAIYLAEVGFDITLTRDLVKRELQRHGYRVLPDHELPINTQEMEMMVKRDLKKCRLSIHLIGDSYGDIPAGSDKSIVDIQNQLAAEHCNYARAVPDKDAISEFSRLIWISPSAKFSNESQKEFVENIKRDAEKMTGAELLQTPLEDLKNIIRNKLLNESQEGVFKAEESGPASEFPKVYLIYDNVDAETGKDLAQMIQNSGNEVLHPMLKGELLDVRSNHFDNLRKCDVAMIYYGNVNEQWVQMKVLDVLKAPGLGRTKPMLSKTIFVEKGPRLNKEKFKNYDISVIENSGNTMVSLEPFMAKINKAR